MASRAGESLNQLELVLLLLLLDLLLPTKVTFSSLYSPQVGWEGRRSGGSLDHLSLTIHRISCLEDMGG